MNASKIFALVTYAVLIAGLVACPDSTTRTWIAWLFGILAVAHLAEFVLMQKVMRTAGGSMMNHFLQTMLFGFVHWMPLKKQQ